MRYFQPLAVVTAFLVVFSFCASAHAETECVKSIQQHLFDAGFDPNGIDGAIGNGTRAAASDYLASNPGLPELSGETVLDWCRAISTAPSIVATAVEICSAKDHDVDDAIAFAGEWYYHHESLEPVLPYAIFVSEISDDKVEGYYAHGASFPEWQQAPNCIFFRGTRDGEMITFAVGLSGARTTLSFPVNESLESGENSYAADGSDWSSYVGNTHGWIVSNVD